MFTITFYTIWYNKSMDATQAAKLVNLELVVPFDVYGSTENVPIPSGKDEMLYSLTLQFILLTVPQKEK